MTWPIAFVVCFALALLYSYRLNTHQRRELPKEEPKALTVEPCDDDRQRSKDAYNSERRARVRIEKAHLAMADEAARLSRELRDLRERSTDEAVEVRKGIRDSSHHRMRMVAVIGEGLRRMEAQPSEQSNPTWRTGETPPSRLLKWQGKEFD